MRMKVDAFNRAPSKAQYEAALKELVNGDADKARILLAAMASTDDPLMMRTLVADTIPITKTQKLLEYVQGNLLWSPKTHEVNTTSGIFQVLSYMTKAGLVDPKHFPNAFHGLAMGYKDAVTEGLAAAWRGEDFSTKLIGSGTGGRLSALMDIQGPSKAILETDLWGAGKVIGPIQRFPRRILAVADVLQRMPVFKAEMYRRAGNAADAAGIGILDSKRGAWMKKWADEAGVEEKVSALHTANEYALYGKGKAVEWLSKTR